MPVKIMLINAVFERMSVVDVSFMPFIESIIIIKIESTPRDAKEQPAAIKNVLRILFSFDL